MGDSHQIENEYFLLEINSVGAEIKRIFAKVWQRELLWIPQDENAKKIWNRTSPLLFPIVGKLKSDQYNLKGKNYQMSQHGFARDKNFKHLESKSNSIEFLLEADQATFKQYPFCFELRVKFILDDKKLKISYSVKNDDRQDIYFSIGAHPAFATPELEDYEIHFEKKEKAFFQLSEGMVDWKNEHRIDSEIIKPTKELFSNDALIFKDIKSKYIDLINHKKDQVIRMHGTNTPYFGIWAKDSVPFICLEPWFGVSDDASHDQNFETKRGIQMLSMGEIFNFSYTIELMTSSKGEI